MFGFENAVATEARAAVSVAPFSKNQTDLGFCFGLFELMNSVIVIQLSLDPSVLNHLPHDLYRLLHGRLGHLPLFVPGGLEARVVALELAVEPLERVGHEQVPRGVLVDDVLHLAAVGLVELDLHRFEGDHLLLHAPVAVAEHDLADRHRQAVFVCGLGDDVGRDDGRADKGLGRPDLLQEPLPDLGVREHRAGPGRVDGRSKSDVVCRSRFGGVSAHDDDALVTW